MRAATIALSFVLISPNPLPAVPQQTATASLTATTTLQQSLAALVGNASLTDVTLSGTVRRIAGSDDESGTATLKALSTGSARADLSLASGIASEIFDSSSPAGPAGTWLGPNGVLHTIPLHNLFAEPAWFFPTFAISRRLSTGYVVTDLGPEMHDGQQVEHISVSQNPSFPSSDPLLQHLTQLDFYLNSVTFLPDAISFSIHPDNNAVLDIPVEIDFSDYRSVSGAQVPFHIRKFLNNSLLLDFQVQNAAINSGLSASAFAIH